MIINWNTLFANPPMGIPQVFGADIVDWSYFQEGQSGTPPITSFSTHVEHGSFQPGATNMVHKLDNPGISVV
jgi:hypothetical protein